MEGEGTGFVRVCVGGEGGWVVVKALGCKS